MVPATPCTCHLLRRLARRVTQDYDRAVAPAGLTITQYSLLQHLRHRPGASASDLAQRLGMERTTLLRTLKPVVRAGLARYRNSDAGRSAELEVTPRGLQRLRQAKPLWTAAQAAFEARVGAPGTARLHALLRDAIVALDAGRDA